MTLLYPQWLPGNHSPSGPIDKIAGIEARGFILGGAVAHQLSAGFVPIRKKGKLPGEVVAQSYDLEYGSATLELPADVLRPGDHSGLRRADGTVMTVCTPDTPVARQRRDGA